MPKADLLLLHSAWIERDPKKRSFPVQRFVYELAQECASAMVGGMLPTGRVYGSSVSPRELLDLMEALHKAMDNSRRFWEGYIDAVNRFRLMGHAEITDGYPTAEEIWSKNFGQGERMTTAEAKRILGTEACRQCMLLLCKGVEPSEIPRDTFHTSAQFMGYYIMSSKIDVNRAATKALLDEVNAELSACADLMREAHQPDFTDHATRQDAVRHYLSLLETWKLLVAGFVPASMVAAGARRGAAGDPLDPDEHAKRMMTDAFFANN